jgi:hypothetical protein
MSQTLRIVDGQIDIDSATGQINVVAGDRKAGQDMAECLLQDYLSDIDYGSYLRSLTVSAVPGAGELFIRHYIADAIQRLQAKQQQDPYLTAEEQIVDIIRLDVSNDGNDQDVFFVSVATASGQVTSIGAVKETQLNHQFERF